MSYGIGPYTRTLRLLKAYKRPLELDFIAHMIDESPRKTKRICELLGEKEVIKIYERDHKIWVELLDESRGEH